MKNSNLLEVTEYGIYNKKKGVGKALLSKVEEWVEATGAKGVRLVSGAERTGAHNFYKRCGYSSDKQKLCFNKIV